MHLSKSGARPPPTFKSINLIALPIVALARLPDPNAFAPPFIPISAAIGPFTINNGAATCVVAWTPFKLNFLSVKASIAARTTGAYSALHPAIIILTANTPRLKPPHLGGTLHSTKSGSPPRVSTNSKTLSCVGGTTGRPSVQPSSKYFSIASSKVPFLKDTSVEKKASNLFT